MFSGFFSALSFSICSPCERLAFRCARNPCEAGAPNAKHWEQRDPERERSKLSGFFPLMGPALLLSAPDFISVLPVNSVRDLLFGFMSFATRLCGSVAGNLYVLCGSAVNALE